jgi:ribosomal-protein-alanine N-acetyltransferase
MNLLGKGTPDAGARAAARPLAALELSPMSPIESHSLRLEPLVSAHADEMFRSMSAAAIYDYMPAQPPVSASALRERYAHLEKGHSADGRERWLNWVVRLSSRQCVGFVQSTIYPGGNADFAFAFAPEYWGRSVAFEACQAVLPHLGRDFEVRALYATVDPRNSRSIRLLQRLGFGAVAWERYPNGELAPGDLVFLLACGAQLLPGTPQGGPGR